MEIASPRIDDGAMTNELTIEPVTIKWKNLWLKRRSIAHVDTQAVLSGVSGRAAPGDFLVITGPSKVESVSLLECLAGFHDTAEGEIIVNGRPWDKSMHEYIAYVLRDDLFYETLTVYEHLLFQARQRLQKTHSLVYCIDRVNAVIDELELDACRDIFIGGCSVSGINAEERKRVAIATALLTNPSVLLVEEPTHKLSTFMAESIIATLRRLAYSGRTVVVTLHHPASHCFQYFGNLYLLAEGACVYDDVAVDCVPYFASLGFQCPDYTSPIDYVLYLLNRGERDDERDGNNQIEMFKSEWAKRYAESLGSGELGAHSEAGDAKQLPPFQFHRLGCCHQYGVLFTRHVTTFLRFRALQLQYLLCMLLTGVVFGLVYLQLDLDDQKSIQNFAGAFFYTIVVQMLLSALWNFGLLPREAAVSIREYREFRGDWYYLLSWYVSRIASGMLWLIAFSVVLFVPIYLLVGIGHGFKLYFYMQLVVILAGWAAVSLVFITLFLCRRTTIAALLFTLIFVLFVAFGGLVIDVSDIPDYLIWLHYISPVKYSYEALMTLFWGRIDTLSCDSATEDCIARTGEQVLEFYSLDNRSALTSSILLLIICAVIFFLGLWFWILLARIRRWNLRWQWSYSWSYRDLLGLGLRAIHNGKESAKDLSRQASRVSRQSKMEASDLMELQNHYIQVDTPRANGKSAFDGEKITIGWRSLWLKQKVTRHLAMQKSKKEELVVLDDASGSAKHGEVLLVTGSSSYEIDALLVSLTREQRGLQGKVTLNGVDRTPSTQTYFSFVERDNEEAFLETLSVQEHLAFQANVRLAGGHGCCCYVDVNGMERVEAVMQEMDLSACRYALIRYLSAADRKRLSIATALLTQPSVLLIQEPTHDLDSYAAEGIVLKLRQLARSGRTVIVTMAHPSSHLFGLFDQLYLLSAGTAIYHGKVSEAVEYFASLGFACPMYTSPVDYFVRQLAKAANGEEDDSTASRLRLLKEAWSTRYSDLCLVSEVGPLEGQSNSFSKYQRAPRVNCCSQLSLLFGRHLRYLVRFRALFWWYLLWTLLVGVVFGLIFLQLDLSTQQDIRNYTGALFYIIVIQMLLVSVRMFLFMYKEIRVVAREHRGGWYYLVCWYLSRLAVDLPILVVQSIVLFAPVYLLIGIGHGFKLYIYMQLVIVLAGWCASALVMIAVAVFRRIYWSVIVFAIVTLLFVVFGGLLLNVDDAPDYLIWIHYISPVKYGYEALMKLLWIRVSAIGGCDVGSSSSSSSMASASASGSAASDCIARTGEEVLEYYSMSARTAAGDAIIQLELALLCFFVAYVVLSIRLRRENGQCLV